MRISIRRGDRGFDPSHVRKVKKITVDGVEVTAITADEEEGFADCLQIDPNEPGKLLTDADGPVLRRLTGKVVIELHQDGRSWDKARRGEAKVQVGRCPQSQDILVQVYSVVRPGAIKQGRLARAQQPGDEAALSQKIGLTGGWLAELLCDEYGDTIDPSQAARSAMEQGVRMIRDEISKIDLYK